MIGFIGVGNMAGAIISGVLKKNLYNKNEILIYDKDSSKYDKFDIAPVQSTKEICEKTDLIFLCVKPQVYNVVLQEISHDVPKEIIAKKTFVSIAAGISTTHICNMLGVNAAVVRVMPNTPLLIGEGASALCSNDFVSDEVFTGVCDIFASMGATKRLTENMMNRIIAVNGSSPAYVYLFAKAICDGAKEQGITDDVLPLVIKTILGSAKMMEQSNMSPDELIAMVTSPNGTTLAALQSFEADDFCGTIKRAMQKCTDRAEEIAKETERS
ncbi:MAG: pyrroline-5-carboxylate reductase [Ruminococcaceae bacterium]|nr:pyrroline-5-carboxylate reductase [Oscillospiraceae bacterium]